MGVASDHRSGEATNDELPPPYSLGDYGRRLLYTRQSPINPHISALLHYGERSARHPSRERVPRSGAMFSLPAYRSNYFHLHKLKSSEFRNWGIDNRWSRGQPPNTENESREWIPCTSPGLDFVNSRLILVNIFLAHLINLLINSNQDCR